MNALDLVWRKSSYSGGNNGACVELAASAVRDSKNVDGPILVFGQDRLAAFVSGVRAGRIKGD
jgi:hypothetical protein